MARGSQCRRIAALGERSVPRGYGGSMPPPGAALGGGGTRGEQCEALFVYPLEGTIQRVQGEALVGMPGGSAKRGRRPKAVGAGGAKPQEAGVDVDNKASNHPAFALNIK